jgi:hypothetical protein
MKNDIRANSNRAMSDVNYGLDRPNAPRTATGMCESDLPRMREIPLAISSNMETAEKLSELVTGLEQRLESVLRPSSPEPNMECKNSSVCGLADVLQQNHMSISRSAYRLREILDRLEL